MTLITRELLEQECSNINIEERIDLSQKQITSIDRQLFKGLTNLQTIDLSGNQISFVDPATFSGLMSLKSINLSDNQIKWLAPTTFNNSTSLQVIHLLNSKITSIEPTKFTVLTNLKYIYLSYNQITFIEPTTFNGLTSLQEIYLSHNQIEIIDQITFAGLDNLQTIKMHENDFKTEKLTLVLSKSVKYVSFKLTDTNDIESVYIVKSLEQTLSMTTETMDTLSIPENDEEGSPKTIELKDKYKDLNVILGEGSYGVVFKAESIQQKNKLYAIKKLKMPFNSEMRNEFLKCPEYTESKLIFSLATSNEISRFAVISEECFFDRANYLYYASEFSEEGNLRNRIDNNRKLGKQFPEEQIAEWSKEIICGLEFLHRNGIIHRNIKPSNILLKEDHLKLCDLGEAKNFIDSILDTVRVSVSYWSPELILFEEMPGIQITNKTDIWSAGVVIYELITLDFPFKSVPIRYSIKNNKVPELQKDKPKHFQILINMMLHKEPTIRADSSELKAVFDYLKFISNFV